MGTRGCLKLISWNCDDFEGEILELRVLVKEHSPDIILIQETKLPPGISLKIPNYHIFHNDYNNRNSSLSIRDTATIFVKNTHFFFLDRPARHRKVVNAIGVIINIPATHVLSYFSVYYPVNDNATDIMNDLNYLLTYDVNTCLIGGFNANYPSRNCN